MMDTEAILAELADALERLAQEGGLVLGVSRSADDFVTWDLSPAEAQALAAVLRSAGLGEEEPPAGTA
jgi:3-oxoacyl-(acyl-carrier-protein) synthase